MDIIPNNVKVLLDVKIYKQDKPGSTSSSSSSSSTSSFGNGLARGIGSSSPSINDSFGSGSTSSSFSPSSSPITSFSPLKGGSVKQDIVPYRSSMTFQKLSTDTVLFDPLVKLTDASIKSSGKYTQLQFLIPDKFNELILKMNKESGKINKTYFYSEPDLTKSIQTAILENNTIVIKTDNVFKLSYIQLKNASKNIQDKPEYNKLDIYNTFIDDTKPNDKLIITNDVKMNRLKLEATINGSNPSTIIFYSKTSLELLLDATKDGTVSNNMKLTMNNLFALNSKMFLDSGELSIYKQSQSKWLYNLNSYETLNKEQFLFKHKLKPDYFGQLKYNIIKKLTEYYNDEANRRKYEEFNNADKNPKLKDKYVKNYAMVDDDINTIIKDEFTLFLINMNIKDFPSIDYFNKYKEYLNKEYSNIKDLDSKNISVEVRFVECPFFYIYSFKWNKEAYDKAAAAISATAIAATGTGTIGTPTPTTGTTIEETLKKKIDAKLEQLNDIFEEFNENIEYIKKKNCDASKSGGKTAICRKSLLDYTNYLKNFFNKIIEINDELFNLYTNIIKIKKFDTLTYIDGIIKTIMPLILNIHKNTTAAAKSSTTVLSILNKDIIYYNAIATLNYLIIAYKNNPANPYIKNKLDSALNNWQIFMKFYYTLLYYDILINSDNKFISIARQTTIELLNTRVINDATKQNYKNYIKKLDNLKFVSNPTLFEILKKSVDESNTEINQKKIIGGELQDYYTNIYKANNLIKTISVPLTIDNINTLTYENFEYITQLPNEDIKKLTRVINRENNRITDETLNKTKTETTAADLYSLITQNSTEYVDEDSSISGGGKLIQYGGAENTTFKDLLIKYFDLYTEYQNFICPKLSTSCSTTNNSPSKLSVIDKESGIKDDQNFFGAIFTAINQHNKKNTGIKYSDGTVFSATFEEFYAKINTFITTDTKNIFNLDYTDLKKKFKTDIKSTDDINETKLKFKNNTDKTYQALVDEKLPFKFKDTVDKTEAFIENLIFFQNGKYYLDDKFLNYIINILEKYLKLNLIIINNEFKIECKLINNTNNTSYNIFLFKDIKEQYYLIEYNQKSLYTNDNFNTSEIDQLGINSPPLFIYLYLFKLCKEKCSKLFDTIYNQLLSITDNKSYIAQITKYKNDIEKGTKTLLTLGSTSTTTIGQSNANMAITKSAYCYYITVSLDLYEGKLPFMQKQTIGCDIKRNNIMNEFTELTGIKVLPSIIDNKYLSLLPQDAAKPSWFNSISSFFKSKEGAKSSTTTGSSSTPSISSKAKHKGGTTRRKIILTYKRQNNIKNVKEIKERLSRKLHNITHKLLKI